MFENLTSRLSSILRNISQFGFLTEENIKKTLREVRIALLEADVALPVIHNFINHVKEKSIGHVVHKTFTPSQELIKIVYRELILVMGGQKNQTLNLTVQPPATVLVVGTQGVGKTTSLIKIGKFLFKKYKKKILTVSVDTYRSAAIQQLQVLAKQANIDFFLSNINQNPLTIASNALKEATHKFYDILLIDTAGRLHIDHYMMDEIRQISDTVNPVETLLVIDAMTGQNTANVATAFNSMLSLTGVVLTKVDCDTRGGSALSACYITGKPIKFLCFGEGTEELELFYPERIAARILGMGDMLALIEDIERKTDLEKNKKLEIKLKKGGSFDLTDFLEQLRYIKNMGGIINLIKKIPGMKHISDINKEKIDNKVLIKMEAIINSMTIKERTHPNLITGSHKRRIAAGCGMHIYDVNRLLKQFNSMQHMLKKIKKNGIIKILNRIVK